MSLAVLFMPNPGKLESTPVKQQRFHAHRLVFDICKRNSDELLTRPADCATVGGYSFCEVDLNVADACKKITEK